MSKLCPKNRIAIIDLGGQYTHLICQKINRLGVDGYIVNDFDKPEIRENTKGIILSGGPNSVCDGSSLRIPNDIYDLSIPILGICYGHQLMAQSLGGNVSKGKVHEYGMAALNIKIQDSIFEGIKHRQRVWMSHGDSISKLPIGFNVLASTSDCEYAAIGNLEKLFFGVQFHPEVSHTECGQELLRNFLYNVCGCVPKKERISEISKLKEQIRKDVGKNNIFFLVSGGVDSTVAFKLCCKTIEKDRVRGLCIDTGLMRKNEIQDIKKCFKSMGLTNIDFHDASDVFLKALSNVHDSEEKRIIIGEKFLKVQNAYVRENNISVSNWILGQGTIYPDTIESGGTKHSSRIKTHHNRVDAIENLKNSGRLIEPMSSYYKDEIIELAKKLGLPAEIVNRNPFPGPGLAIRCMTSKERLEQLEEFVEAYHLFPEMKQFKIWKLPQKTVGVQGDRRSEGIAVIIEKPTFNGLEGTSTKIINNILRVNRVTYLVGSIKPLNRAKIVKRTITKERLDLLREADFAVNQYITDKAISKRIWQFPVIILPLQFEKGETIILRPVSSTNGMTAEFTKISKHMMFELSDILLNIPDVDAVLYDITNKPPATIEWE